MSTPHPRRVSQVAILASLLIVALSPGSASAAPTVYGGDIGKKRGPFALQLDPSDDVEVGLVAFDAYVSCPGYRGVSISDALPLVSPSFQVQGNGLSSRGLSAEGEWEANGLVAYSLGRYEVEVNERFTGRVVGAEMSGTLRAKAKIYRTSNGKLAFTCRTARRRWEARSAPGRIFAGATRHEMPVVIELADDGATIRRARVAGWATCGNDAASTLTLSTWRDVAIDAAGAFRVSRPYAYRYRGARYRGREGFDGDIQGAAARGTFSDRWTERRSGRKKRTCATGSVRYTALSSPAP